MTQEEATEVKNMIQILMDFVTRQFQIQCRAMMEEIDKLIDEKRDMFH